MISKQHNVSGIRSMVKVNLVKVIASAVVIPLLASCATTPPQQAAQETAQSSKPTAEAIEQVSLTSPLEQAGFWLQQYSLNPDDHDIGVSYIKALMNINSFEEANEVGKLLSVSFPRSTEVWTLLGKSYNKIDKPIEALKAYGEVVELAPESAAPLASMGAIFDNNGDHETAQMAYERALKLDPNRAFTLANYGLSLSLVGKLGAAEEALKRASELPEATTAVRQNYALVLGLQGKFDEARAIAAIDAPERIADRNTTFLKNMIGDNPRLQAIADEAAKTPRPTPSQPAAAPAELPKPAPTETVASSALPAIQVASIDVAATPEPAAAATTPQQAPKLKLRARNRSASTGGEE